MPLSRNLQGIPTSRKMVMGNHSKSGGAIEISKSKADSTLAMVTPPLNGVAGLGSKQSDKPVLKPLGVSVAYGTGAIADIKKLNFDHTKKKPKNLKLKL